MKTKHKKQIIEIVEIGNPKSLIHRLDSPIDELIKTADLIDELNKILSSNNENEDQT